MFELCKENFPPPAKRPRGTAPIYPFHLMEVGGRPFDAPRDMGLTKGGQDKRRESIRSSGKAWAKRHDPNAEFMTALVDEHTVRCWRIK